MGLKRTNEFRKDVAHTPFCSRDSLSEKSSSKEDRLRWAAKPGLTLSKPPIVPVGLDPSTDDHLPTVKTDHERSPGKALSHRPATGLPRCISLATLVKSLASPVNTPRAPRLLLGHRFNIWSFTCDT